MIGKFIILKIDLIKFQLFYDFVNKILVYKEEIFRTIVFLILFFCLTVHKILNGNPISLFSNAANDMYLIFSIRLPKNRLNIFKHFIISFSQVF